MEAARRQVDEYLLDLLAARTFGVKDFTETEKASVACSRRLPTRSPRRLAMGEGNRARRRECRRDTRRDSPTRIERLPTPLTQTNRSAGRDAVRRNPQEVDRRNRTQTGRDLRDVAADRCPTPSGGSATIACPTNASSLERVHGGGQAALRKMRAEGRDPMDSEEARHKLGEANARRRREESEWDRTHEKPDPDVFTREILPLA